MKVNTSRMWRSGIAMLLALCLVVGFFPTAAFAAESVAYIDGTGYSSVQAAVDDTAVTDVDGDGFATPIDAMLILQYYVGDIAKFPVEG